VGLQSLGRLRLFFIAFLLELNHCTPTLTKNTFRLSLTHMVCISHRPHRYRVQLPFLSMPQLPQAATRAGCFSNPYF
jgi:hypothetical protein